MGNLKEYLCGGSWRELLRIQTVAVKSLRDFLVEKGFVEMMPIITSTATDPLAPDPGSSIIGVPKIEYYDEELVLTQSMILHKQVSLVSGLDKIYVLSPNIRLERRERRETGKHLFEFTQLDFEVADVDMDYIMSLVEDMVMYAMKKVADECWDELCLFGHTSETPSKPFKRYTTHELCEKFGGEWEHEASLTHKEPFWAICHKREFYDREDPERPGHYRNYDLIWPSGYGEALSGGEREWEYDRIMYRLRECKDVTRYKGFEKYLELARDGLLRPSAGAGLGIERFIRYLTGMKHIGDVQLFRRVPGEEVML